MSVSGECGVGLNSRYIHILVIMYTEYRQRAHN